MRVRWGPARLCILRWPAVSTYLLTFENMGGKTSLFSYIIKTNADKNRQVIRILKLGPLALPTSYIKQFDENSLTKMEYI